jgi:hypothetical protein
MAMIIIFCQIKQFLCYIVMRPNYTNKESVRKFYLEIFTSLMLQTLQ